MAIFNYLLGVIIGLGLCAIIVLFIYVINLAPSFIHWFFHHFTDTDYFFMGFIIPLMIILIIYIIIFINTPYNTVSIFSILSYICLIIDSILCIGLRINYILRKISVFILINFFCFLYFDIITDEAFTIYNKYKILFSAVIIFLLFKLSLSYVSKLISKKRYHNSLDSLLFSGITGNLLFLEDLGLGSLLVILLFPLIERFNWLKSYNSNFSVNVYQSIIVVSIAFIISVVINFVSRFWVIRIYYPSRVRFVFTRCFKYILAPIITLGAIICMALIMFFFSPDMMVSRQLNDYSWNLFIRDNNNKIKLNNISMSHNNINIRHAPKSHKDRKYVKGLQDSRIDFNLKKNILWLHTYKNKKDIAFKLYKFTDNSHYYFQSTNDKNKKFNIKPTTKSLFSK